MRSLPWNFHRIRSLGFGVFLLVILFLPGIRAVAQPQPGTGSAEAQKTIGYFISITRYSKRLCVGQKATLTLDFGSIDPLLVPLYNVSSISVSGTINTIEPAEITPQTNSGAASVVYTASNKGTDRLVADLFAYDYMLKQEMMAAQDETTIEVREKCKYHFSLESELDTKMARGSTSESVSYQIELEGDLVPSSDDPSTLTASGVEVTVWTQITELIVPDCELISQDPGYGTGVTSASAVLSDDGMYVVISLGPIQNFTIHKGTVGRCGDQTIPVDVNAVVSSTSDLMTGEDFSSTGGTLPVRLSVFDKGVKNITSHGGTASYWALMTLKAVE
jgi:hypothetical protein